ncbi:hypothetical protein HOY34_11310 [Xinfangfangia sp. D13-10-4-6]|nr:hypothetical protein [Pseudogemmobacter hezensis]
MFGISFHKRLRDMRDRTIRQPDYRVVYGHTLMVAHMAGHLIADDHPGWARIEDAVQAARGGDLSALDTIEREIARLMSDGVKPPRLAE